MCVLKQSVEQFVRYCQGQSQGHDTKRRSTHAASSLVFGTLYNTELSQLVHIKHLLRHITICLLLSRGHPVCKNLQYYVKNRKNIGVFQYYNKDIFTCNLR